MDLNNNIIDPGFCPSMQVLTSKGFKYFDECEKEESFFIVKEDLAKSRIRILKTERDKVENHPIVKFNLINLFENNICFVIY